MNKVLTHLLALITLPLLLITGCNSEGAFSESSTVKPSLIKLERIEIVPTSIVTRGVSDLVIGVGNQQSFEAIGFYSDGSSQKLTELSEVDWQSSDQEVGNFYSQAIFLGKVAGKASVVATKQGITSNTVNLTVTGAEITSIQVTPAIVELAKGQTEQLTAIAMYSDKTSADISDSVTWVPVDSSTATVTSSGLLFGVEVGSTVVTAEKNGITSNQANVTVKDAVIKSIQVTPAMVNVAKGQMEQLTATAIYSDNSSSDVTDSVDWVSVDESLATVASSGALVGVEVGTTTVLAQKDGITSNTANVVVSDAVITAIQVTPSIVELAKGQIEQLSAVAIYSDNTYFDVTDSVVWESADTTSAIVTRSGQVVSMEMGATTVVANLNSIASNTVDVVVTDAVIEAIQVTPAMVDVAKGQAEQLTAVAIYSDKTSSDISDSVTWFPVDTSIATVTQAGLLAGVEVGSTIVTATKDEITSNSVNVTVTDAVITEIQVTPATVDVAKGQVEQLTAVATYSDGTESNISDSVTWLPVDTSTATVTSSGMLEGVEVGITSVTAIKDGITSNTVDVTVSAAVIISIQVSPEAVNVAKGQAEQLTAIATYSDGTQSNVSNSVTWLPLDMSIATVTPAGLLTGLDVGSTSVTAVMDGITSNRVHIAISAAALVALEVTPETLNVRRGSSLLLKATASYSDGSSSEVIATTLAWISDDTTTATVNIHGLVTGLVEGSVTVTATKDGVTSNSVTVNITCTLADACLDVFDVGSGKLFTNSPSAAYIDSIGGLEALGLTAESVNIVEENNTNGPKGTFYRYNRATVETVCTYYNNVALEGRTNWRLATRDELRIELYGTFNQSLYGALGWPARYIYWSSDEANDVTKYGVNLTYGRVETLYPSSVAYSSCVSSPDI